MARPQVVNDFLDQARPVRSGEALAVARLRAYLGEVLGPIEVLEVQQFPGGYSNLTYLLKADDRELVLRRPPFGSKVKRAHDMGREYRILSRLSQHFEWAPKPLLFCDDAEVIGAEFYVMNRLVGVILRRSLPTGMVIDAAAARRLSETLLDALVALHQADYRAIGLGDFGKPKGYVARQVDGWTRRYAHSKTDDIEDMPYVAAWLAAHMPDASAACVIHNDYKFDNVIYADHSFKRIVGVLDWEMATIGDPLMDLGTMLCYWVEPHDHPGLQNLSFGPTNLPGMYSREALVQRYAQATSSDVSHIIFYYAFGLYKTAVVLQQIYYRYHQGVTQDPRFAGLNMGVRLLAQRAREAIEQRRL